MDNRSTNGDGLGGASSPVEGVTTATTAEVGVGSGAGVVRVDGRGTVKRSRGGTFDPFGLRALIIAWCLWLLASWSITLAINATAHAVRWVVFSAVFGLMAVWPALRLSQQLPWYPPYSRAGRGVDLPTASAGMRIKATLLDWICLAGVFQIVIWPLMLLGGWTDRQTLWLDLAVLSWSLLTGAVIGFGRVLPGGWARMGAMAVCLLLLFGEPVWIVVSGGLVTGQGAGPMRVSPIQALWELTTTIQPYDPGPWVVTILSTAAAAGLAWAGLILVARLAPRNPSNG